MAALVAKAVAMVLSAVRPKRLEGIVINAMTKAMLRDLQFIASIVLLVISISTLVVIMFLDTPQDIRIRAACDKYVSALINSDSLLEVTRAGLIVDHLHCGVRRRI